MAKGDCGIQTVAHVTGSSVDHTRDFFQSRFGKTHILGKDMRELLTDWGWTWVNARGVKRSDLPQHGIIVVTTRHGFYAMDDGVPHMGFEAPICGYYVMPDSEDADYGEPATRSRGRWRQRTTTDTTT